MSEEVLSWPGTNLRTGRPMNVARRIQQDELTRNPSVVFQAVRRGETVVVEDGGQSQVVIIDPIDLQILQAVISYYVNRPRIDPEAGLADSQLAGLSEPSRFELALAYYLAEAISLSRAAEVLKTSWMDLRDRFSRLGIPLRTAPIDEQGARQDVLVAESTLS